MNRTMRSWNNGQVIAFLGDCQDVASDFAAVDLVISDPPYGTTPAKWDVIIPASEMWAFYKAVTKPKTPILLFGSQPFTSLLITSNLHSFRTNWVWDKVHAANFANANRHPMKVHEDLLVFCEGPALYRPQKTQGKPNHSIGKAPAPRKSEVQALTRRVAVEKTVLKFPKSIQTFPKHSSQLRLHSTQKPVEAYRYWIETYSEPDALVLDNFAGSGTLGEAVAGTRRKAILIEKDPTHFDVLCSRMDLIYGTDP